MLCATATAGYICRVNISTAGALIMDDFDLSQVEMGRIFSGFLLGYALFQVPAGMLADRWGARRILAMSSWLWVGSTAVQAIIGWGPIQTTLNAALMALVISRFVLGITESPTYPGAARGISKWILPKFQGRANGIVISSIGLGSALAPLIVSNVMVHWGWRIAMLVSGIPALVIAILWLTIREPEAVQSTQINNGKIQDKNVLNLKTSLLSRSFILLTLSYTLQGYVGYIFVTWFYLYLVQERHFDLLSGAWMSSLPWLLSIISIPLGGWISDRLAAGRPGLIWGRRAVPLIGMSASGIMISIGAHTGSALIAAVSLAFATALILSVESPFWTTMMIMSGSRSGMAGGIMNMGSNIGGFISPALTPILAEYFGWENSLHIAAGLAIIAAILWVGVGTDRKDPG